MGEILYFPPKEFSPRFGDQFFTATIRGYEILGHPSACGGQYAVYLLEVCRGREKWIIKRRFSEFDRLNISISHNIPSDISVLPLPPKTCFRTVDEVELSPRSLCSFSLSELSWKSNDSTQRLPQFTPHIVVKQETSFLRWRLFSDLLFGDRKVG